MPPFNARTAKACKRRGRSRCLPRTAREMAAHRERLPVPAVAAVAVPAGRVVAVACTEQTLSRNGTRAITNPLRLLRCQDRTQPTLCKESVVFLCLHPRLAQDNENRENKKTPALLSRRVSNQNLNGQSTFGGGAAHERVQELLPPPAGGQPKRSTRPSPNLLLPELPYMPPDRH
jgi:hypothetical protein